jgi:protein-tyrosine phosphatase
MFFRRSYDGLFERIPLEVSGRLYVSPMPYGPYDPGNVLLKAYRKHRIEFVIMLVTDDEMKRKLKRNLLAVYEKKHIKKIRFPFSDYTSPHLDEFSRTVDRITGYLRAGARMAVHCNAGVGRTGVMTTCIVRDITGMDGPRAIEYVKRYMKTNMTDEQRRLVAKFKPLAKRNPLPCIPETT